MLLLMAGWAWGAEDVKAEEKQPSKGLLFFYRTGAWVDKYLMHDLDTSYICLPEHSWSVAFTTGTLGINSTTNSTSKVEALDFPLTLSMLNRTTPSVDFGFNAGFRGFGFGYAWDAFHAYARRLNFSFGSKHIGVEFSHQTSTNIHTDVAMDGVQLSKMSFDNVVTISNTNLDVWYALNAAHYSHNAATKQSYIQRKSAGSLLLHLSYMSSQIRLDDTITVPEATKPTLPSLMSGMQQMTTRQVAVGIGYGINYTPNQGKVLLHMSATAKLVFYSINQIYYTTQDTAVKAYVAPCYNIMPERPVHVSGSMRAAVSWEINQYVHMSAWGQAENVRFATGTEDTRAKFSNWNWHAHLNVGVRFGVGKTRVRKIVETADKLDPEINTPPAAVRKSRLPQWITDYFFSPRMP